MRAFPADEPKVLWRVPIHRAYAGPSVADGRVFAFDRKTPEGTAMPKSAFERGQIPGDERLVCLDADSGKILWEKSEPVDYTVSYSSGPRTTPTIDGDRIYTIGAEGHLLCRSVADGSTLWSKDFKTLPGACTPVWGFSASPLIDGGLLICLAGGEGCVAVAFDKLTGEKK